MDKLLHKARLLSVILLPVVIGCAQTNSASHEPISRQEVVDNLKPIVKIEHRGAELTTAMRQLSLVASLSPEDAKQLKEYYDVYYIYHNAAATSLAEGDLQAYHDQVRGASAELDSLEAKLRDILRNAAPESSHGSAPAFSRPSNRQSVAR